MYLSLLVVVTVVVVHPVCLLPAADTTNTTTHPPAPELCVEDGEGEEICDNGLPCRHGDCIDGACKCHPGWVQENAMCHICCNLNCGDHGQCVRDDEDEDPYCVCDPMDLYTGTLCEEMITTPVPTTTTPRVVIKDAAWPLWRHALIGVAALILLLLVVMFGLLLYIRNTHWWTWKKIVFNLKFYEDDPSRQYDAFVSYRGADDDQKFVHGQLVNKLEKNMGFRLCVDTRDFEGGKPIADNILTAIKNSKRTILVISPDFAQSHWTKLEYRVAQKEMLSMKHRIIPIIYKNVSHVTTLDPSLKFILESITYIEWPQQKDGASEEEFWKKLHWSMPKVRRASRKVSCVEEAEMMDMSYSNEDLFPPGEYDLDPDDQEPDKPPSGCAADHAGLGGGCPDQTIEDTKQPTMSPVYRTEISHYPSVVGMKVDSPHG